MILSQIFVKKSKISLFYSQFYYIRKVLTNITAMEFWHSIYRYFFVSYYAKFAVENQAVTGRRKQGSVRIGQGLGAYQAG